MIDIPVYIAHDGNQEYVRCTVKLAETINENVVLFGDDSNKGYAKKWVNVNNFGGKYLNEFKKVYMHMSFYPKEYEASFYKRIFAICDYMLQKNVDAAIIADSDVCIYENLSKYNFAGYDAAINWQKNQKKYMWAASIGCSYWKVDALKEFCEFIIDTYRDNISILESKWKHHIEHKLPGGVCEMTLAYLWMKTTNKKVLNTAKVNDGQYIDSSFTNGTSYKEDEYQMDDILNIKKFKFIDKMPFFYKKNGELVESFVIHCQGSSKKYIPLLVKHENRRYVYFLWHIVVFFSRVKHNLIKTCSGILYL